MTSTSIVDQTAEQIAFGIATGKYAAGERLPSVRKIAAEFGINPSTVQIVLATLQSNGFITVHPGIGFVVKDIEQFGGIATWRYLFRLAQQLPERACRTFEDFLAMRLVLIQEAVTKIALNPKQYDPSGVKRTVQRLELIVATTPDDLTEIARTELHATRMMMIAVGQTVYTSILNSIGEIYIEVPSVIQAMYVNPEYHVLIWHGLLRQWERGHFSSKGSLGLRDGLRQYDISTIDRYRKIVTSALKPSDTPAHMRRSQRDMPVPASS